LLYEPLDKRHLLAGASQADADPAPRLLDLPPGVSATLERMLASGGGAAGRECAAHPGAGARPG
ncbi:MAG: hypothetical protein ACK6DU_10610, partial [Planctomycetota bacterium]